MNALGSLTKKSSGGQSYNPYAHIDNKYLNLSTADEFDDDEWLYMTVSLAPVIKVIYHNIFLGRAETT